MIYVIELIILEYLFRSQVPRAWISLYKDHNTTWIWLNGPMNYTNPTLTEDDPPDDVVWAGLVTAEPNGRWKHDDINKDHHFICQNVKGKANISTNDYSRNA